MLNRVAFVAASVAMSFAAAPGAGAADWPEVKLSAKNTVPACATPGRLMAMVKARNPALDARLSTIAAEYKRHGEALGVRWDYVFFQMLQETGDLTFKKGGRVMKAEQFNFAGLGSTNGEAGETFADVSTGARAHIEHVMLYAGLPVENPVAERTRKVQQWGVLTAFHQGLKRNATFGDVIGQWAPKSKSYADALLAAAQSFTAEFCGKPDPSAAPDRIAALAPAAAPPAKPAETVAKPSGVELAKKAVDDGKVDNNNIRSALGAGLAKAGPPPVRILNDPTPPSTPEAKPETAAPQKAALTPPVVPQKPAEPPKAMSQKCRVWTASYGGDKALIIRSVTGDIVNFTVLDVNPGQESARPTPTSPPTPRAARSRPSSPTRRRRSTARSISARKAEVRRNGRAAVQRCLT